jgi:hypothetical protein
MEHRNDLVRGLMRRCHSSWCVGPDRMQHLPPRPYAATWANVDPFHGHFRPTRPDVVAPASTHTPP